ncbi:MAG TPA: hypothetical protein PLZ86_06200 [bacterium]|nr:hypothetical protein [bacterium]
MTIEQINPMAIKAQTASKGFKKIGGDFGSTMLDAANAMSTTAATAGSMYGSNNAMAALNAAFSGIGTASQAMGGGMSYGASFGGGVSGGAPYLAAGMGAQTIGGSLGSTSAIPGTDNLTQMDMINSMNQNNLGLLELQATMQSNMQGWNTKSNILSADHRARMAMIEKFTARG